LTPYEKILLIKVFRDLKLKRKIFDCEDEDRKFGDRSGILLTNVKGDDRGGGGEFSFLVAIDRN